MTVDKSTLGGRVVDNIEMQANCYKEVSSLYSPPRSLSSVASLFL